MSINSIIIPLIEPEYTAEYIANVFWCQLIAQVGIITLLTYVKNQTIYSVAYITIDHWHDTENAYNFIQRLKNPKLEARIVHKEDYWWAVYINKHKQFERIIGSDITIFNTHYFKTTIQDDEDQDQDQEDELTSLIMETSDTEYTDINTFINTVNTSNNTSNTQYWNKSYESYEYLLN